MIPTRSSCTGTSPPPAASSRNSMEDVWKDISLASLCHHDSHPCNNSSATTTHTAAAAASFRGMIFQDFLATTTTSSSKDNDLPPSPPQLTTAPASTLLMLNSGARSDLQHLQNESATKNTAAAPPTKPNPQIQLQTSHHPQTCSSRVTTCTTRPSSFVYNFINSPGCSDALDPSSVLPSYYKKRDLPLPLDHHQVNDGEYHNSTNRRHKRMMKNRESAARSRARKQAYTNELELELAHLQEENARLKTEQAKFLLAAAPTPSRLPKRHTLFRTSTAPF